MQSLINAKGLSEVGEDVNRTRARKLFSLAARLIAAAREMERNSSASALLSPAQECDVPAAGHMLDGDPLPLELRNPALGEYAAHIYRNRRKRDEIFGDDDLFRDPAWDILLDLYIAAHQGVEVSVTSACVAAAVPETTALRWLKVLEKADLVTRERDKRDHRRVMVRITRDGFEKMSKFFIGHSGFMLS